MKAAIITCTHDVALYLKVGKLRLPQGVRFAAMRECFDRAGCYEVRLEGEGIPETLDGDVLPRCELVELPGGSVELLGPWKIAAPVPAGFVLLSEAANA
jgi:hypothetical protein